MQGYKGNIEVGRAIMGVGLTGCTYSSALTTLTALGDVPATSATTGRVNIPCLGHNRVRLCFAGTAAQDKDAKYAVYGIVGAKYSGLEGRFPIKLAAGGFTLGATAVGDYGGFIEASTSLWADTVTETTSIPGAVAYSPADDSIGYLVLDVSSFTHILVEVTLYGASSAMTTMDVMYQLFTSLGDSTSVDIAGTGLATSALQTTGNALLTTMDADTGNIKTNTDTLVTAGGGGYVRQDSTGTIAKETGGNLATVKTNTDTLVTAGGGGYVRQDSTATIAKESGGNLATVKTNTDGLAAAGGGGYVRQDSTATIAKETGGNLAAIAGGGVTFSTPIALTQAGAGRLTILALEASKVIRLHALVLTMDTAAGTLKISYDDDGAGTNEVNLTGVMALPLNGGVNIPFNANPSACLKTAAGKQLTLTTTGGAVKGYAICSKATS